MPVLIVLIISSLSFYVYYKVLYFRAKRNFERRWLTAKSTIALGAFVTFFGINRIFISQETLPLIISVIFILVGSLSIWSGISAYRFYLPLVEEELQKEQLNQKQ